MSNHKWTLQRLTRFFFLLSLFTLLFFLFLYPTNSTDLGWHLKYGEYFTQHGKILKENTFSYIMPDFVWTNDSWVYDLVMYHLFHTFGFYGLAIAGALVGVVLVILLFRSVKTSLSTFVIVCIPFYIVVHTVFYHGFRAQTVSLVLLALTLVILRIAMKAKQMSYFVLLSSFFLFLFWANWHGEYLVGLTYIAIITLSKTIDEYVSKQKIEVYKTLLPILGIGFVASFITPFGIENHIQGIVHVFSSRLDGIGEWSSWPKDSWIWWTVVFYAALLLWIVIQHKKLQKAEYVLPLVLFGIQAFLHRRIQGIWAVVTFPLLVEIISGYKISQNVKPAYYVFSSLLALFVSWQSIQAHKPWISSWDEYCVSQPYTMCSEQMVEYLRTNPMEGTMFNFYNWGGYLIWRLPEEKVFIDGRMVSWKDPKTGFLPYQSYETIIRGDGKALEEFEMHTFGYAVMPRNAKLASTLRTRLGWIHVYEDARSVILKPINN